VIESWNIRSLTGKEHKPVEEDKLYFLDVVYLSNTVELAGVSTLAPSPFYR